MSAPPNACLCRVLCEAWLESGELRAWLSQERAWLAGLQRRLRRSPNAPADAEEISDELYVSLHVCLAHLAIRYAETTSVCMLIGHVLC